MNRPLCEACQRAQSDPAFESTPGMCMRFVREVVQRVYGSEFDQFFYKTNAKNTGLAFKKSAFSIPVERGSVPGDLLFWTRGHGPHGHVAIRMPGNIVIENSIVHRGKNGGKGTRHLTELQPPDVIVRLRP